MKKLYFAFLLVIFAVVTANATVTVRKFPTDTPTSVLTNNETNPTFNGLTISAGSTLFMAEGSSLYVDSIFPNAEESISIGSSVRINDDLTLGDGSSTPTITFDGDAGTDGSISWDATNDAHTLSPFTIYGSSANANIKNTLSDGDISFVINDGGVADTAIFIDGSASRVGIFDSTPSYDLDVSGVVAATDIRFSNRFIMTGYGGFQAGTYIGGADDIQLFANGGLEFYTSGTGATKRAMVLYEGGDIKFGSGQDVDTSVTFDANSNDGSFTWMEDENYFKFNNNLLVAAGSSAQMDRLNMIPASPITTKGMIWYDGYHFFGILADGSSRQLDN